MDKMEMATHMALLEIAYNREFNIKQVDIWYEIFQDYDSKGFREAIINSMKECRYFPTIADVRSSFLNNWKCEEGRL